jgi:hypothetical protein
VVVLLTIGLALFLLALLPGARRPLFLLGFVALVCALVVRSLTADVFLVAAAGIVTLLVGLLAGEVASTLDLVSQPRREFRRAAELDRREQERSREAHERERRRRRRQQERRAA